jgi:tRNA threonylcarbamoyl adenosine modification protein (Sua5/YciO/YrdC/YwlC family)
VADLDEALAALRLGLVVAIPTDTVYGVAALPDYAARLFEVKRRPERVDLPVLVASADDARRIAVLDGEAEVLATRWWPGPLTLVVPRLKGFDADLGEHTATVGVRAPDHDLALELLALTGPLATTSANRHGQPPLTTAAAVREVFGEDEVAVVVDGGPCEGEPSTVLDCTLHPPRVLRQGALAPDP